MFERFTDRARRVVVLAQEEARKLNHSYIGTEHILLGLISEGEGVAAAVEQNGAVRASGGRASGTFDVRIDGKPEETTIDPDTGKVVPAT